jgi:hypothetical protein
MAAGLFKKAEDVYNINMRIVKSALKMYVDHWRKTIDNSTMEDARNMAILGILLLVAVIGDALRAL